MKIIWHGTASVELQSVSSRLLTDPFVPLKGAEWSTDISSYDGFSDILVTHGHFDHIADIPEIIRRNPETTVHCTDAPYETLLTRGVPETNLKLIRYNETILIGRFSVNVYHGKHAVLPEATFSRVKSMLFNKNAGNLPHIAREALRCRENDETVVYVIHAEGREITIMGSLNLRGDIEYPTGSDILMLPYNGWEDNLPPAVSVIKKLAPESVILTHWDNSFPPLTGFVDREPLLRRYPRLIIETNIGESIEI